MLPMKTGLLARALRLVPYLTPDEVRRLWEGCRGRHRDRDALLILVLFQTGLLVSEALTLTVGHLNRPSSVKRRGSVTVITPDLAEGDLSPKRPEISPSHPKSGPFA